jgi:hypothetical protein
MMKERRRHGNPFKCLNFCAANYSFKAGWFAEAAVLAGISQAGTI